MKRTITYLTTLIFVVLAFSGLAAQEKQDVKKIVTAEGLVAQTICPVMGGEIDKAIYTDYQGQRVYFCCAACIDMFGKDPEAVFKKIAGDKILLENVQTACPVSGDPIDKEYFRYYMGRGLYFCGEDCALKFDAEPEKYLKKMTDEKQKAEAVEKHEHGKEDQEHKH